MSGRSVLPKPIPRLGDEDFAVISAMLAELAGLTFDSGRREALALAVAGRAGALGLPSVEGYLARLHTDLAERQSLLEEVLVGETHFWRNPPQMAALEQELLPALLHRASRHGRRLRIWSAGCSTGEEPYSIAILLAEELSGRLDWDVRVVASDVSQRALDAAATGVYGPRALALLDPERRRRWFSGEGPGRWRIDPQVAALVEFRQHNLVTEPALFTPADPADVVLCRNVTI
ncbi:MAG: CheR family methyltransferase [Mycobacteriales bacterium]